MSQVVRYVHISHGNVTVKESFVDLIRLEGKTAAVLTEQILNKLKCDDLDVANLRGQGYDRYNCKAICETRWSSQYDPVDAVVFHLDEICEALEQLRDSETETYETRSDSTILLGSMNSYVFIAYLVLWKLVLVEIKSVVKDEMK